MHPLLNCSTDEWFNGLDAKSQARILVRFDRVRLGNFGDCDSVGAGVSEFRFFFGPGYRVYYGCLDGRIVLLLVGGSKKKQPKDIKLAQKLWAEFQDEMKEG
ncbi:MAG: type II toxin-antitoxin system RelE/ParE family toxin [Acaryochloridaceae cyanobacterium RL_2_7]|nr:type II toxin-antitoxin system RelE/ParE family toxin [Acaryochloridaceae cyanobacterium RL_2_7]